LTPIDLPALSFTEFDMRPVVTKTVGAMIGRTTETAEFGTTYWRLFAARTGYLSLNQVDDLSAFLLACSRGGATFSCYDYFRQRPRAYGNTPLSGTKAIGGAFNGSAVLQTVTNSRTIVVSGLPANFVVNRGCLVEVRKSLLTRSLHMVMANATASAGGIVTLTIDVPLNTTVFTTLNSTIQFERPACLMLLNPEYQLPKAINERFLSFDAIEVFS
jgi:hypothetical protein